MPLNYDQWIDLLENLMNNRPDLLRYMAFTVFDFNEDN